METLSEGRIQLTLFLWLCREGNRLGNRSRLSVRLRYLPGDPEGDRGLGRCCYFAPSRRLSGPCGRRCILLLRFPRALLPASSVTRARPSACFLACLPPSLPPWAYWEPGTERQRDGRLLKPHLGKLCHRERSWQRGAFPAAYARGKQSFPVPPPRLLLARPPTPVRHGGSSSRSPDVIWRGAVPKPAQLSSQESAPFLRGRPGTETRLLSPPKTVPAAAVPFTDRVRAALFPFPPLGCQQRLGGEPYRWEGEGGEKTGASGIGRSWSCHVLTPVLSRLTSGRSGSCLSLSFSLMPLPCSNRGFHSKMKEKASCSTEKMDRLEVRGLEPTTLRVVVFGLHLRRAWVSCFAAATAAASYLSFFFT